ncbi:thiol:disulfide interchange protein DsbA/DsbL [Rhodanobacter sp. 115]|uniref:thiol:disulfide interchange protein DsbA/DsbL n=1 Tax=Rhodanobacter sp. FW021-MT20 TaxID=1162282 RepID=UPI00026100B6|nr:thiol:disulfide interchange protein DsbA/DsbL [Rhodanobacter sp. 115]EIL93398.1 protein-disulfide isomerase [Rhodanobacter sp. 115]
MSKRFASMRMLALLGGLVLASACSAASNSATAPYTNGDEYVTLPGPHQRYSNDGKVEVVEVFSYACIHCAEFAPDAEKLRKALPPGVKFKLLPAPFNQAWLPYARAFYAAKQLGVVQQTHLKLFVEKFAQHYPLNSLDDLADFYARQGVNRAKFMQIATSPEATTALKADLALIQKWGVDATPTIVVDGKYRSNNITSYSQLVALTQWLVKRELAEKGGK